MIIKFLKNGTGDPKLAVSYLLGERDHLGFDRAEVKILRGDPTVFSALATSIKFQYCYTSVVIAWSPRDHVSDEQLQEVLDLFEEHAFAGLSSNQYHMTAVMHADDDGSRHLHILIPRVELTTEKSLNVAPPGHRYYFDPLRDFLNQKYNWARPDDPDRVKTTQPKNHHILQNALVAKAGLQGQAKKTRIEMIDAYIEQRIIFGSINNRDELVQSLKEIAEIGQVANKSISLKYQKTRDRLDAEFYHVGFSFVAYREARTRQTGIRTVLPRSQEKSTECSAGLSEFLERMETVRRKRAEYNQRHYRTKVPQNEANARQATAISYALGATVPEDFSRGTASAVQQHQNDGIAQNNEPLSLESRFEYGETTARLSRTHAQRKLAFEQETQKYECEVNRERQDDQALSRRNQQRGFIQRINRFVGNVKGEIRNTFRKLISQLASSAPDTERSTDEFKILYERTEAIGINRLVNIAGRRTKRRKIFESYKKRKQEIELIEQQKNEIFAMNTISAELRKIQKSLV